MCLLLHQYSRRHHHHLPLENHKKAHWHDCYNNILLYGLQGVRFCIRYADTTDDLLL